ncbi:hypothetical protein M2145_002159 [Lachnospiraceae bacterium PF1-21]|uniref:hypothetical protein n=1 Tax=Ohessyouella blattaphilus TaxID=2949333 RepID=UPI003E20E0CA
MLDKLKRVFALLGAIILLAMYANTLIFALMDSPKSQDLLKASIACTFIIPVFLYAYSLVYRVIKEKEKDKSDSDED